MHEAEKFEGGLHSEDAQRPLEASQPPVIGVAPAMAAGTSAPLPAKAAGKSGSRRRLVAMLLSLCLGLFLADGIVSLVDDSLTVCFGLRVLMPVRGMVLFCATVMAVLVYGLMALTPMIPKRLFVPVALFNPVAALVMVPVLIYAYGRHPQAAWLISAGQVVLGLSLVGKFRGGLKPGWPLVREEQLELKRFSWLNLTGFVLVNVFVLLPAVAGYLFVCASLAVGHFSEGFLALRPGGLTVQVRTYVRNDGKKIQLAPMAHVGEAQFYRKLSRSFPTNSIILMEGVSDSRNLLTNKLSYRRVATSLGLTEQQKEFEPSRGEQVAADVDVEEFGTNTIALLNLVGLLYSKGLSAETVLKLVSYSPTPEVEVEVLEDVLHKRSQHVVGEIRDRLTGPEMLIVPWGVAHMPEIAREVRGLGFRLEESGEYQVVRFGPGRNRPKP